MPSYMYNMITSIIFRKLHTLYAQNYMYLEETLNLYLLDLPSGKNWLVNRSFLMPQVSFAAG